MADLASYDEINLYKDYWEQGYVEELMIEDSLYTVTGDISVTDQLAPQSMCFNKSLFKEQGLEEPYDLVERTSGVLISFSSIWMALLKTMTDTIGK